MTEQEKTNAFREVLSKICNRKDFQKNNQNVHTPYKLCGEMLTKLNESVLFTDKIILTFNLEFVEVLCYDCQVKKENIWFITDCPQKAKIIEHKRFNGVNVVCEDYLLWSETTSMKFDIIVGNPPFHRPKENNTGGKNNELWRDFVIKSDTLLKDDGFLCLVHPMNWREKPNSVLDLFLQNYNLTYLELNSKWNKSFAAATKVDWYVAKKTRIKTSTSIKSENEEINNVLITQDTKFIPNIYNDVIKNLFIKLNKFEKLDVRRNAPDYSLMKNRMDGKNKYEYIYTKGRRLFYKEKFKDFNCKKVILSDSFVVPPFYDDGELGTTYHFPYIVVNDEKEAKDVIDMINSSLFKFILKICLYSNFQMSFECLKNLPKLPTNFQLSADELKEIKKRFD